MTDELTRLSAANQALIEAKTLDEIIPIMNLAETARLWAKKAKVGLEAQNHAAEIKLRAERKAGEVLRQMDKAEGTRGQLVGPGVIGPDTMSGPINDPPTYAELGIEYKQASRWQAISSLPGQEFEDFITETKDAMDELTSAGMLRLAQTLKRIEVVQEKIYKTMASGQYRIWYADPPWRYNDSGLDEYGHAERHYPTMSIDDLCMMGPEIISRCAPDAVLFLWVTSPFLEDCFSIIHAWGFEYKTSFVWDKVKHNYGHYNSVRHEFLLVCTRGSCTPDVAQLFDSVQTIERTDQHSEKPQEFRTIIDTLYPEGARIELFARAAFDGWEAWGNEPG